MAPASLQQAFDLAVQHHKAGRLQEAENIYTQILAQDPAHIDALHQLGMIARRTGRNDLAVDLIRRAISLRPNFPAAFVNLGNALKDTGQADAAIAAYRQAILLNPNLPEAHANLGNVLKDNGQLDEAIAACRRAITLNPNLPGAYSHLGSALRNKGQLDDCLAACRKAIALNPNLPEPHNILGNALKDKGQLDDAIAAYRHAIALRPDYAESHNNLGIALRDNGQLDDCLAAFRQAIALNPSYAEAHSNLGSALQDIGQPDDAIAAYRQALAISPRLPQVHSNLIMVLHYHPRYDARTIADELRLWNRQHAEPLRSSIQVHPNNRAPNRRLRIGYVSPDFRDHVVGRNLLPLFREHNRSQFEITCFAQTPCPDAMTAEFQQHADRWHNIVGFSDEQVARQIRDDQIDILVDLALHTAQNRLLVFARKPAPVQATFAGYPGSTGLSAIDYRLSDPFLDPVGMDESVYSERTLRLPDSFWCFDPLGCRDTPVSPSPALSSNGRITFGCLNNFCKVNDDVLSLWAKVLLHVENSRLLLLAPIGSHRSRALKRLQEQSIDPARVEFIAGQPRQKYLETYHRIDVGLDTFPYNGHTTSLDSLWMGVPVITLVGDRAVARAGWCQLSNIGLMELAAHTPDEFVRIAADLASDLSRLAQLRSTLRQRMEQSPLMNAAKFARDIETAYRQMWRTWCENELNR